MQVGDKCGVVERSGSMGCGVRTLHEHGIVLPVEVRKDSKTEYAQGQENKTEETN